MKKGKIVFLVFASLWAILLVISAFTAKNYPLWERIIVILIAILPCGIYSTIKFTSQKNYNKHNNRFIDSSKNISSVPSSSPKIFNPPNQNNDVHENNVQAVQTKVLLASKGDDVSKVDAEALVSGIKVTVASDTSDLVEYSKEVFEKGYTAHVNSYKNLDFNNISIKYDPPKSLKLTEKKFLKVLANQQVGKLDFPVYWTYEYKINFKEVITKLIENGYIRIAPATEDLSFLTVEQLKTILKLLHLPSSGKKQDLIARIYNQSGTSKALKELNLDNEHFILTEIGKQAVESIQKPVEKTIKHNNLYQAENDQIKQLENLGVEKYQIIGTLDTQTCSKCGKMDGKVFDIKKYEIGVTAPPFCEDCRCTITPYFDDDFGELGERAARGYDGKTYYVPGNMTYSKWKKTIQK